MPQRKQCLHRSEMFCIVQGSRVRAEESTAGVIAQRAFTECAGKERPPPVRQSRVSPGIVGGAQAGRRWGVAGSVLALETLQRALQLGNRARSLLVGAALSAGLIPTLLAKLDWRTRAQQASAEHEVGYWPCVCLAHCSPYSLHAQSK